MRSAYLVMVEPDENHNKYYQMTQKTTDIFEVRYGRVGAKGITRKYPISRWASIYESKLQKGYVDNSHLYSPTINTRYKKIPDKAVRSFWQDIENYSKKMLESNYSVSYDKVTQEMIKEATDILKNMRNQSNVFCIKILIFLLYNKNSQFHNWLFLLYNNLHGIRFFLFLFFFVLFCIAAKRIIFIKKIFFLLFIKDMFKSNNSCCSDNCTD